MYIKHILWSIVILVSQVLIFNHVQISGYGTPLVCVFPILLFNLNTPRWIILITGFCIGIIEDMFINTPGIAAASFTFVAMCQPGILKILAPRDDDDNKELVPSPQTLGWENFGLYTAIITFLLSVTFFTLESFSFFNLTRYLLSICTTWGITLLLLFAIEGVRSTNKSSNDR